MEIRKQLPFINFCLLLGLIAFQFFKPEKTVSNDFEEINVERLNIVGSDGHLYIAISNPERQALATQNGVPLFPDSERDLSGLIFFNRVGDEVGGIYYDGDSEESYQGITFDQQKNDQVMAIMKDEYLDGEEWKRWYGMFFRERSDSIRAETLFKAFEERTKDLSKTEQRAEYLKFKQYLDEEINVYRMFLGREENKEVGLFIFDSQGKERIKLYVDAEDKTRLEFFDENGDVLELK